MKKTYKQKEEKLTSEGAELRQPVAELEAPATKPKQAEEALQAEKNKLQSLVEAIEYGLSIQDKDYNILYQSQRSRIISGDHLGEKCYRAYEGQDRVWDWPSLNAFSTGQPSHTLS